MKFLASLLSRKLAVTAAAVALVQTLPMNADWKGICTAAIAFAYVIAQAIVDATLPPELPPPPVDPPVEEPKP